VITNSYFGQKKVTVNQEASYGTTGYAAPLAAKISIIIPPCLGDHKQLLRTEDGDSEPGGVLRDQQDLDEQSHLSSQRSAHWYVICSFPEMFFHFLLKIKEKTTLGIASIRLGFDPIDSRHRARHYIHEQHIFP
jgi:hypothetical protein